MSGKWYTEEFKIEAVKQITERGYLVSKVAERLGITPHSLYNWLKKYVDSIMATINKLLTIRQKSENLNPSFVV